MSSKFDQALAELVFRGGDGDSIFETAARLLTSVTGWRFAGVGELSGDGESVDVLAAAVGDALQPVGAMSSRERLAVMSTRAISPTPIGLSARN